MSSLKNPLFLAGIAAILAGCTVGPDYRGAPSVTATGKAFVRSDASSAATTPAAQWWTALGDAELNRLIDETLATNPSVDVARARVREARANLRQQTATGLPNIGSSAAYLRTANVSSLLGGSGSSGSSDSGDTDNSGGSGSGSSSGGGLNLYVIGFDATWELDFFGGNRRAVEGAAAGVEASEAHVADAIVSLTAEVAQSYVALCDAGSV